MKAVMVAIGGGMVGRKDFPIIFVEVSLNFRFGPEFLPLLSLKHALQRGARFCTRDPSEPRTKSTQRHYRLLV